MQNQIKNNRKLRAKPVTEDGPSGLCEAAADMMCPMKRIAEVAKQDRPTRCIKTWNFSSSWELMAGASSQAPAGSSFSSIWSDILR